MRNQFDITRGNEVIEPSIHQSRSLSNNRRSFLQYSALAGAFGLVQTSFPIGCRGRSPIDGDQDAENSHFDPNNPEDSGLREIEPDLVWGKLGLADGRFQKPRAMTIDRQNNLYIVDKTGRIQVFDGDGNFLRKWNTPDITNGKPTGLSMNRDGLLMVADTHYFQILFYTPDGEKVPEKTIGGTLGPDPGQFAFVTDVVQDLAGNYFISEYGEFDRIQKYSSDGEFICRFGETGDNPLQFSRPQSLVIDKEGNLWISDSCNHRIQVVRCEGDRPELVKMFGKPGNQMGQFRYPYGIHLGYDQSLYVAEFGNHRVQKLSLDGKPVSAWGKPGRKHGFLDQPWALAEDSLGRLFVLDTGNNRIQRIKLA